LPKPRTIGWLKTKYGLAPRRRYSDTMGMAKARYPCRQCGYPRVRRLSVGIWRCSKCGYTFAGGAYQPTTKIGEATQRASSSAKAVSPEAPQVTPPGT